MEKDAKVEEFVDAEHIRQLTATEILTTGNDPGLDIVGDQTYPKNWKTHGQIDDSMRALKQPIQLETIESSVTLTKSKNEEIINAQNQWIDGGKKEGLPYNW